MRKLSAKWNDTDKPWLLEWIILGFIVSFCFIMFNHPDILATSYHGMDLLDITLKGRFFDFYDYTESTAVYHILIYIIFAVWSIPVYAVYGIAGIPLWGKLNYSEISYPVQLWYKLLPCAFCIGAAYFLYKIGIEVGISRKKAKWMLFFYFSSPILIFSQLCFGQYDSISMFFTMYAIYAYMQKKYYKFSVLMAISIPLKLFSLFLFLPLLLLVEKRIIHIIKHCAIGMSIYLLNSLLFFNSQGLKDAKKFSSDMFGRFFLVGFQTIFGLVSFFLLGLAALCIFCYLKKVDSEDKFSYCQWTIYVCLAAYSMLFMCILWHPQWVILLVPFLILAAFMNDNFKMSVMILIAVSIGYLLLVFCNFPGNVDECLVNRGPLPHFIHRFLQGGKLKDYFTCPVFLDSNVFVTIFFGSLLINLIMKAPTKSRLESSRKLIAEDVLRVERGYIWVHMFTIFIFIAPTMFIYFFRYIYPAA